MRTYGVNYDTGLLVDGRSTRYAFDADQVRRELEIIAADLNAGAVRVSGNDLDRLRIAGEHALDAGLELWFSPSPHELEPAELVSYLARAAEIAHQLSSRRGADVVLVLGCELSLFCAGFVPGDTWSDRLATLADPLTWSSPARLAAMTRGLERWGQTQRDLVVAARAAFAGRITYAAGTWEQVDWSLFDIVSVDAYRDAGNEAGYRELIRGLGGAGKPVAVTEFGCCTYRGAADRGGSGWMIVDRSVDPPVLDGDYRRDESEPATYADELLHILDEEGVDAAFWFSFAGYELPHRAEDPRHDLDVASYGLVAALDDRSGVTYPDLPWEPKRAFHTLAAAYARLRNRADAATA